MTKAARRAAAAAAAAAETATRDAKGPEADGALEGSPDHCPECGLRLVPATRQCPIDPDAHTPEE